MFTEQQMDQLGHILLENQLWLAVAESCTGGLVASRLTDIPGSSRYFLGGVISYTSEIKSSVLGVQQQTLQNYGTVSPETAQEMALGIRKLFASTHQPIQTIIGLSVTGIAGPGGGSVEQPIGLVYFGISSPWGLEGCKYQINGSRLENKSQFASQALISLLLHLSSNLYPKLS